MKQRRSHNSRRRLSRLGTKRQAWSKPLPNRQHPLRQLHSRHQTKRYYRPQWLALTFRNCRLRHRSRISELHRGRFRQNSLGKSLHNPLKSRCNRQPRQRHPIQISSRYLVNNLGCYVKTFATKQLVPELL